MTLILAIYGAVIATGGLAWQVVSWSLRERTRLVIEAELVPTDPTQMTIHLVNRSAHRITLGPLILIAVQPDGVAASRVLAPSDAAVPGGDDGFLLRALSAIPDRLEERASAIVHVGGARFANAFPNVTRLEVHASTGDQRTFVARATHVRLPNL